MTLEKIRDEMLTSSQAAHILHSTISSLAMMRRANTGPTYYQPGGKHGHVYYLRSDIDKWFQNGKTVPKNNLQPQK